MNSAPDKAVLDLDELKARCLGNMDLVERVLSKLNDQVDKDLEELERAAAAGNAEDVAQFAHRIKGVAASVSARSLFESAAAVEEQALANSLSEIPTHLHRLRDDRSRLKVCLQRHKPKSN